jgi:hypothetical protein
VGVRIEEAAATSPGARRVLESFGGLGALIALGRPAADALRGEDRRNKRSGDLSQRLIGEKLNELREAKNVSQDDIEDGHAPSSEEQGTSAKDFDKLKHETLAEPNHPAL